MSSEDIYQKIKREVSKNCPYIDLTEYIEFCIHNSIPSKIKFESANHHILPKWAFPEFSSFTKNPWNKATLYHKDHVMAHFLLWKAWRVAENASPLLLMFNINKKEFSDVTVNELLPHYQQACEEHAKRVSFLHTGKTIKESTKEKLKSTLQRNAENNKGHYYCIEISTGNSVKIPIEEYRKGKDILYKSFHSDKPAWNSGKEMPMIQDMLTVIEISSGNKVRISSEEYNNNKNLYQHLTSGLKIESITGLVLVTDITTGETKRISREEYISSQDRYKFHSSKTKWYNDGIKNIRVADGDSIPEGFVHGMINVNMDYLKTRKPQENKQCPHCGKFANPGNFKQHHGDNCKSIVSH